MISLIVAVSQNGVIGKDNSLPWHIKEDLKRFKELTTWKTIIMGRKTFESLPNALPNRHHIVITRDRDYESLDENVIICNDIEFLINKYKDSEEEVFVIGGSEIYRQFLPYIDKAYLTIIFKNFEGDSYFDFQDIIFNWRVDNTSLLLESEGLNYRFVELTKPKL